MSSVQPYFPKFSGWKLPDCPPDFENKIRVVQKGDFKNPKTHQLADSLIDDIAESIVDDRARFYALVGPDQWLPSRGARRDFQQQQMEEIACRAKSGLYDAINRYLSEPLLNQEVPMDVFSASFKNSATDEHGKILEDGPHYEYDIFQVPFMSLGYDTENIEEAHLRLSNVGQCLEDYPDEFNIPEILFDVEFLYEQAFMNAIHAKGKKDELLKQYSFLLGPPWINTRSFIAFFNNHPIKGLFHGRTHGHKRNPSLPALRFIERFFAQVSIDPKLILQKLKKSETK
jgi:hypothetical protein